VCVCLCVCDARDSFYTGFAGARRLLNTAYDCKVNTEAITV